MTMLSTHDRLVLAGLAMMLCSAPAGAQPYAFTTLAGKAEAKGFLDGAGSDARLNAPTGIVVRNGTVYINEYWNPVIRKISPDGVVTTVAGQAGKDGSTDGVGAEARFFHAHGLAIDAKGTLYATDYGNSIIRKISPGGVVTTVAGQAGQIGSADGTGAKARFDHPEGLAVDGHGTLYVADTYNCTIRKITSAGVVTTIAGLAGSHGSADGRGGDARFDVPIGIAIDSRGTLYIVDGGYDTQTGNSTVRKLSADGTVTTIAGLPGSIGTADGQGQSARFHYPVGIAVAKNGTLYIADTRNHSIRQITPAGVVTTVAGTSGISGGADGTGPDVRFGHAQSIAVDSDGTLYVADTSNHTVRKGVPALPPRVQRRGRNIQGHR